ncbi:hypothetical protein [Pseudomonas sp. OTU5201]|uniref:hypothetical protein n=1 Tax=Pseudomonas sp. OTU5201 TaxID=3043850 RepID=UPI00313B155A
MTAETDSHAPDTVDAAAQELESLARIQRTRALYHFLDRVDAIIKKRCALMPERQAEGRIPGEQRLQQENQPPQSFGCAITPRGDDELIDNTPVETPRR